MEKEKIKIKILGASFAHRRGQNTAWLVNYALKAAENFGEKISEIADIETEFIDLSRKNVKRCLGCVRMFCIPGPYKGENISRVGCPIKDDYVATEFKQKLGEADGYIFGSPVFNGTYTSLFKTVMERTVAMTWDGIINDSGKRGYSYLNNKPAGFVAVATWFGQELALMDMNRYVQGMDILPVTWLQGARSISGPPFGKFPYEDDGKEIGAKKDRMGQWTTILTGRRVAEIAVMIKLARRELGKIYDREFMQWFHPPHGGESWAWKRLKPEDEKYLQEWKAGADYETATLKKARKKGGA